MDHVTYEEARRRCRIAARWVGDACIRYYDARRALDLCAYGDRWRAEKRCRTAAEWLAEAHKEDIAACDEMRRCPRPERLGR